MQLIWLASMQSRKPINALSAHNMLLGASDRVFQVTNSSAWQRHKRCGLQADGTAVLANILEGQREQRQHWWPSARLSGEKGKTNTCRHPLRIPCRSDKLISSSLALATDILCSCSMAWVAACGAEPPSSGAGKNCRPQNAHMKPHGLFRVSCGSCCPLRCCCTMGVSGGDGDR